MGLHQDRVRSYAWSMTSGGGFFLWLLLTCTIAIAGTASAFDGPVFAAWGTAQQGLASSTVSNATVRMIARPSLSGGAVSVRLENTFGTTPITIGAASIGKRATGAALVPGSNRSLTFGGQASVTLPAGAEVYSDLVALDVVANEDVAVSMYVSGFLVQPSQHSAGFVTSYLSAPLSGDHTGDEAASAFSATTTAIYWLAGIDVDSSPASGAIVALGGSTTDGTCGAGVNQYQRWTDVFARRLQALPANQHMGVINAGIAGNRLTLAGGTGPSGLERYDRDVLGRTGVTHVVLAIGNNDVAGGATAAQVIEGTQEAIDRAHAQGVKVVAGTIYPRNSFTASQNAVRNEINNWIRHVANADAVFDIDEVLKSPTNPDVIDPPYNCDGIHPNAAGYKLWADAIDLAIFAPPPDLTVSPLSVAPAQISSDDLVTFTATVTNGGPRGLDGIAVRFLVDGAPVGADRTLSSVAAGASTAASSEPWAATAGNHTVQVMVDPANAIAESNEENNSASSSFVVEQRPTGNLTLSPTVLWPPNHKLVAITQTLSASEGATVSGPLVTSNEPQSGCGADDVSPDWVVSGVNIELRAERCASGRGRVYTVTYILTNKAGGSSQVSASVSVPRDQ